MLYCGGGGAGPTTHLCLQQEGGGTSLAWKPCTAIEHSPVADVCQVMTACVLLLFTMEQFTFWHFKQKKWHCFFFFYCKFINPEIRAGLRFFQIRSCTWNQLNFQKCWACAAFIDAKLSLPNYKAAWFWHTIQIAVSMLLEDFSGRWWL